MTDVTSGKTELTTQKRPKNLFLRLISVLSVNFLTFVAIYIQVYCQNEWVQSRVKSFMFGTETLKNSSACSNHSDPDYVKLEHVQQETARRSMYSTMTVKSVALVTTFLYTMYTDAFGRKYLLILSSVSIGVFCLLSAIVYMLNMSFLYLILTNLVYALTGTSYGVLSATYSYVADVTDVGKEREIALFLTDVCYSLAGTAGTYIAGEYIESFGFVYPSFTAAGISSVAILIAILLVPESLKPEHRISRPNIRESVTTPFKFYCVKGFIGSRVLALMLFVAFIFADVASVHRSSIETIYQLGMPFCWSPARIGLFGTVKALSSDIAGLVAMRMVGRCMGAVPLALLSLCTTAGSLVLEAVARTDLMLFLISIPACLSTLPSPLIRASLSAMSEKHQQGAMSAGLILVQTICSFVTAIVDNMVYAATLPIYNGLVFLVFAAYCLVAAAFLSAYLCIQRKDRTSYEVIFSSSTEREDEQANLIKNCTN